MEIAPPAITRTCPEREIYERVLELNGAHVLELGCGRAELTRHIATHGHHRRVTALEVDEIQHALNLQTTDLPNVEFTLAGAQAIPVPDGRFDVALMFKSLHHVPADMMVPALREVARVLKPGGLAYISEPIFAGDLNDILRLFHDEARVRQAAFEAVRAAVDDGTYELVDEIFFSARDVQGLRRIPTKGHRRDAHATSVDTGRSRRGAGAIHARHDRRGRSIRDANARRPLT